MFRIAPTDRGIAFRLAEYLIPKGLKVALLADDSGYGQEGEKALEQAFGRTRRRSPRGSSCRPARTDVAPQVLRARDAPARRPCSSGRRRRRSPRCITAARSAGWDVPIYAPPTGADPLVRQQLADRPEWVDGLTFASGRMTAEVGPDAVRHLLAELTRTAYGVERGRRRRRRAARR